MADTGWRIPDMGPMGRGDAETGRRGRTEYMHVLWAGPDGLRLTRMPETEWIPEIPADEFDAIEMSGEIVRRVDWART